MCPDCVPDDAFGRKAGDETRSFDRGDPDRLQGNLQRPTRERPATPYLVFNEAQKPAILEYIKTNKRAGDIYRMLQLEGERYLRVDADPAPAMNDIKSRFSGKDDHAAYQNYYQYGSVVWRPALPAYGRHRLRETRIPARRETMRDGYVAAQRALFRKYLHARMALRG